MRTVLIVVDPPRFDLLLGLLDRMKPVQVQTFFPELSVEALDVRILHRLARTDKVQFHPVAMSPFVQGTTAELRSIVHRDDLGLDALIRQSVQDLDDPPSRDGDIGYDSWTLTAKVIH